MDEKTKEIVLGIIDASKQLTEIVASMSRELHDLDERVIELEFPKEKQ